MLVSNARITKEEDLALDKSASKARPGAPGISIRNGPVGDDMDVDTPTNGAVKRKSRSSISNTVSYKDESDSDDAAPLVRCPSSASLI